MNSLKYKLFPMYTSSPRYIGEWSSGLRCWIRIGRFLVQALLGARLDLGTQLRYEAPVDLQVKLVENAVINIGLVVRLSPREWPKVSCGIAKQKLTMFNFCTPSEHKKHFMNDYPIFVCSYSQAELYSIG